MSHACVIVNVGRLADLVEDGNAEEGALPDVAYLEGRSFETGPLIDLLEPYNENTEVPRYRDYETKREKARKIETVTKAWEKYTPTLDIRFEQPVSPNEAHDRRTVEQDVWVKAWDEYEAAWAAIADLYTDVEVVDAYARYWGSGTDEKYFIDTESTHETTIYRWSTYNPQSKWDYWTVIEQAWPTKSGSTEPIALAKDIDWDKLFEGDNLPGFAFVDTEKGWTENARLGWWGMALDPKEGQLSWRDRFRKWVDELPEDAVMVAVDYHI
jgi:hypothetical protein